MMLVRALLNRLRPVSSNDREAGSVRSDSSELEAEEPASSSRMALEDLEDLCVGRRVPGADEVLATTVLRPALCRS